MLNNFILQDGQDAATKSHHTLEKGVGFSARTSQALSIGKTWS